MFSNLTAILNRYIKKDSFTRRVIEGSGWVGIGKIATTVAGLLSSALLTRILQPDDVGVYTLALSIVTVASLVAGFGLGRTAIRLLGEYKGGNNIQMVKSAIAVVLRLGLVGISLVGIWYILFGRNLAVSIFKSSELMSITPIVALAIMGIALSNIIADIFRGLQQFKYAEFLGGDGVYKAIFLALGFGFIWAAIDDIKLEHAVTVFAIGGLSTAAWGLWLLYKKTGSVLNLSEPIPVKSVVDIAWPIFLTNLIPVVSNQSIYWVLGAVQPKSEVAIYGMVVKFATLVATPTLFYTKLVAPFIAELYFQNRKATLERMLRAITSLSFGASSLIAIIFILWGKNILGLVYGEFYSAGAMALVVLIGGQLVNLGTGPSGQLLLMTGHQRHFFRISLIAGVLSILTSLWLIRPIGALGAAIGQTVFMSVSGLLAARSGYRLIGLKSWIGFSRQQFVDLKNTLKKNGHSPPVDEINLEEFK